MTRQGWGGDGVRIQYEREGQGLLTGTLKLIVAEIHCYPWGTKTLSQFYWQ